MFWFHHDVFKFILRQPYAFFNFLMAVRARRLQELLTTDMCTWLWSYLQVYILQYNKYNLQILLLGTWSAGENKILFLLFLIEGTINCYK